MKKLLPLFVLFIYSSNYCQEIPQVVPPSPEAASVFKFNEVPVSLYSGLHNTTIPLIEINSGGIGIPINLSYHSRGVQVNEIASSVGTGWALNYGGMISRQIRGIADDLYPYGYSNLKNSTAEYYQNDRKRSLEASYSINNDLGFDYFPDKFMINTSFFSGEFYFDKNTDSIFTQKFSDIKIIAEKTLLTKKIIGFQVTDNVGNNYYFGGLDSLGNRLASEYELIISEFSFSQNGLSSFNGENLSFPFSSWFLKKIITSTGEIIEYTYEDVTTTYFRRSGDKDDQFELNDHSISHFSLIQSYEKVLSEISFKEGRVTFSKSPETRLDLSGGYTLSKIKLYNYQNKVVKEINLNYSYTELAFPENSFDNNNISCTPLKDDLFAKRRLFLDSINFIDAADTEKSYRFEYDSQILPSRHSNSIDNWGYYNGKNRGMFISYSHTGFDDAVVDPIKIKAGLLKKIIYPTGGFSVFEYEPNLVLNRLPLSYNELQNSVPDPNADTPVGLEIHNTNPVILHDPTLGYTNPELYINGQYEIPVVISSSLLGNFSTSLTLHGNTFSYSCTLKNDDPNGPNYIIQMGDFDNLHFQSGSYKLIFKPLGDWILHPYGDENITAAHSFLVTVKWHETEYDNQQIVYGPGNRIKKITNYTSDSEIEFSKLYSYKNEVEDVPYGMLLSAANYRIVKHQIGQLKIYDNFTVINTGLFGSYSKDNLGYYFVNEYFLDKNNNTKDKISYNYSIFRDLGSYYKFPKHPVSDNEWLRGLELFKTIYKKENSVFKKIREVENKYLLCNSTTISLETEDITSSLMPFGIEIELPFNEDITPEPYLKNSTKFVYPSSAAFNLNHYVYEGESENGYRTSFFTGGTLDLDTTRVTDYYDDTSEMETMTTYDYDYTHHYNVAKTTSTSSSTSSSGDTLETTYSYASSTNGNQLMRDKNMVGIPLITEVKRNGAILSTQKTVYKDWDINSDPNAVMFAPEFINASKGGLPLETRIRYNKVDSSNGKPLEVQLENGMKISYIWGYKKSQPIAKLENIAYADIPINFINTIQAKTDNLLSTELEIINDLNSLRTISNFPTLANAMITTYTYIPLVGVSTITDPKGDKITYHYDGFNRLEYVTDGDGNVLKENQYHYRTQN